MKILVINSGSSSIKYSLFNMENSTVLANGLVEKIGEETGRITHKKMPGQDSEKKLVKEAPIPDHKEGLVDVVKMLIESEAHVIKDKSEIDAVGHRVVHGGEAFHQPTLITEEVLDALKKNIPLAPLHNPANITGIEVACEIFPDAPQVGIFDTAFHQTMPARAYRYALPEEMYTKLRVRRYGFHGTSHQYVAKKAAEYLKKPMNELNVITLHLGNGASIAAIQNGKSIDTTMGMTPLEGLMMGTRCGDVDPAIHFYLAKEANMTMQDLDKMMNKQSGLKGISGINDMREIFEKKDQGDKAAELAIEMYAYRIKKYLGAYTAALGRVDAIIFTAGIGQNSPEVREESCKNLECIGIKLDVEKNKARGGIQEVQTEDSKVKILVIPTNEELEIAEQSKSVLDSK